MTARAFFRLPYADSYCAVEQLSGSPARLASVAGAGGRSGFIIAPFDATEAEPVLLLRPDRVEWRPVEAETAVASRLPRPEADAAAERKAYAADFARCHRQLVAGRFLKLVLARRSVERMARRVAPEQLFLRACRLYPRIFVALVEAPQCGTWLAATPELLLGGDGGRWHTVALAGTMRLEGGALGFDCPPSPAGPASDAMSWSAKNRLEQRLVADYIGSVLRPFAADVSRKAARTVRAGDIVHLRSDFDFALAPGKSGGELADALHPTPAVCGLPKDAARSFILAAEHSPRSYYSGFMGPLGLGGATNLFVTLRCMRIEGRECGLYAGGGLLPDSVEEQEWRETEAKMDTMRRVIGDAI